jgi:hypothetical protein
MKYLTLDLFIAATMKNASTRIWQRRVALIRTNVSEEHIASIFRVTRNSELGTTSAAWRASVGSYCLHCSQIADSGHPAARGDMFLRNACSYKSHTASSYLRRRHSSSRNTSVLWPTVEGSSFQNVHDPNGSDGGVGHSGMPEFWTLSIVGYSKCEKE